MYEYRVTVSSGLDMTIVALKQSSSDLAVVSFNIPHRGQKRTQRKLQWHSEPKVGHRLAYDAQWGSGPG